MKLKAISRKLKRLAGYCAYIVLLPLLRAYMRRSTRAYVLLIHKNEILLVQNWFGRQGWQMLGGGVHRDETASEAAAREVKEEIGITLDPKQLTVVVKGRWQTDKLGHSYVVFRANLPDKPVVRDLSFEIDDYRWIAMQEVPEMSVASEITNVLQHLLQ